MGTEVTAGLRLVPCDAGKGRAAADVATRAVTAASDEQQHDQQQDQEKGDDPRHLHPAWGAVPRSAAGLHVGGIAVVGVRRGRRGHLVSSSGRSRAPAVYET
jgi:hypothetical protein